ncbi:hypothetical protein BC941DRAFT_437057 [Chlamydoabsidia padenii]|nr:hypothetical protein BC941DRAFT_437057 [Chlamydoabsidia padenii]
MQEVIETTYLMIQESQKRLVRLECSNQLLVTGLTQWMNDNRYLYTLHNTFSLLLTRLYSSSTSRNGATCSTASSPSPSSSSSSTTTPHDYIDLLDTMTMTVQQLLDEAKASLDRDIPYTTSNTIVKTATSATITMTPDQQYRYQVSERNLERAFAQLTNQVDMKEKEYDNTTTMIPPPTIINHYYHHHHHHHHYYHNDQPLSRQIDDDRPSLLTAFTPIRRVRSWFTDDGPIQSSSIDRRQHRYRLTTLIILITSRLVLHPKRHHLFIVPSSLIYRQLIRCVFILQFIYHFFT